MSDLRVAMEHLALALLQRAAATRPPVDVDAIAAAEGLRFVLRGDLGGVLGFYLRELPDGPRITRGPLASLPIALINANEHPLSQRFTKAHELAHHLIDDPRDWVARMQLPLPRWDQEIVGKLGYHPTHEFFAASLLMPRPWVDRFDGGSWRRRDVERFARTFAVTRIAAAVRLEELYGRPRHDIVPLVAPQGELTGLYAQA